MLEEDPRRVLDQLCRESGEDFATLSRLIGKNPSYIQQFVRRGTPRRLAEEDRAKLARYFGIDESRLGARRGEQPSPGGLIGVARIAVAASAGPGALPGAELRRPYLAFEPAFLKRLTQSPADKLALIRVEGDSMAPTLGPGDDLLVDEGDSAARLRDGIYVLRQGDSLLVKRLAMHPGGGRMTVRSDNPAYPDWPDCEIDDLHVVGRVLWAGRRLG